MKKFWKFFYKYFPSNHFIRTNYFKSNGNVFYLIDENGKKKYFPKIKGLTVTFDANNSIVVIHSNPLPTFVNSKIICKENNTFVEIQGSKSKINNLLIFSNSKYSRLYIGKNLYFGGGKIILGREPFADLTIGNNCLFSTNIYIRTSDSHTVYDLNTKKPINKPKDVVIGNSVWLCYNTTILKGVKIADGSIVATGAVVSKTFSQNNVVLAGVPAKIIKENVAWESISYDKYCEKIGLNFD